ncbi:group I truncated hemoglobin [Sphingorhabdus profundilacus]|nr:group 1 truncated hemoglobin [Sphingorhabdus profundilacus]
MKRTFLSTITLSLLAAPSMVFAQVGPGSEPPVNDPDVTVRAPSLPVITDDENLFEAFGGREGLVKIMDDFMERLVVNPATKPFFENSDKERVKLQLVEQLCVIMKGPCTYSGRSMAEIHRGMNVSERAFYALVEEFQRSANKMNVPFRAQNRLIAALAPMHRDIIDR